MPPPSEEGSTDASIPPAIINTSTHGGGLASGLMDSGGSRSPAVLNVTDVLLLAWSYVHANAQKSPRRTAVLPASLATCRMPGHPLSSQNLPRCIACKRLAQFISQFIWALSRTKIDGFLPQPWTVNLRTVSQPE